MRRVTVPVDGWVAGALLGEPVTVTEGDVVVGLVALAFAVALGGATSDPAALGAGDSLKGGGAATEPVQAAAASSGSNPTRPTARAVRRT